MKGLEEAWGFLSSPLHPTWVNTQRKLLPFSSIGSDSNPKKKATPLLPLIFATHLRDPITLSLHPKKYRIFQISFITPSPHADASSPCTYSFTYLFPPNSHPLELPQTPHNLLLFLHLAAENIQRVHPNFSQEHFLSKTLSSSSHLQDFLKARFSKIVFQHHL